MQNLETLESTSNNGEFAIEAPYTALIKIEGTSAMLFHRWDVESVAEKASAAKGSKAKKSDDINSYVYRNDAGEICLPGEYVRQSVIHAAKYQQDPRSPRKSAMDMFKAGVVVLTELCSLGSQEWDYLDRRRVQVQRNGITRQRPAFNVGWTTEVELMVLLPEYIKPQLLHRTLSDAGRLVGVADYRPTYGRFAVTHFEVLSD